MADKNWALVWISTTQAQRTASYPADIHSAQAIYSDQGLLEPRFSGQDPTLHISKQNTHHSWLQTAGLSSFSQKIFRKASCNQQLPVALSWHLTPLGRRVGRRITQDHLKSDTGVSRACSEGTHSLRQVAQDPRSIMPLKEVLQSWHPTLPVLPDQE